MSNERVVLITGAAKGIGRATALRFAQEGFDIAACDLDENQLEVLDAEITRLGRRCSCITMDVTQTSSVQQGISKALKELGSVHVLVNNAAASLGTDILKLEEETWDRNVNLVLKSVYLVTRTLLPHFLDNQQGVIVNIGSVSGMTGLGEEAYSAAKAGVLNLTENMAVKYGPNKIRVNAVSPGTIESPAWAERIKANPNTMTNLKKYYPMGRLGTPEDVANAVFFLASDQASWITGVCLRVDGGLMAGNSGLQRDLMGS